MQRILDWILKSKWRSVLTAAGVSFLFATCWYVYDAGKYYRAQGEMIQEYQERYARELASICRHTGDLKADLEDFESALPRFIASAQGRVEVLRGHELLASHEPKWPLDLTRTRVDLDVDLGKYDSHLTGVRLKMLQTNEPPWALALWRAVRFSIPEIFDRSKLILRSMPFYLLFIPLWIATSAALLFWRKSLDSKAEAVRLKFNHRIKHLTEAKRVANEQVRKREAQVERQEREKRRLIEQGSSDVAKLQRKITGLQAKLDRELDAKKTLTTQLEEDNERLRNLESSSKGKSRTYVRSSESFIRENPVSAFPEPEPTLSRGRFERLARRVKIWVVQRQGGPERCWGDHSKASELIMSFESINPEFVNSSFVRVHNGRYRPEARGQIRIVTSAERPDSGDLEVVLDDNAGRTIHLQYELRSKKDVPSSDRVGFALALLLRQVHKEFRNFSIR